VAIPSNVARDVGEFGLCNAFHKPGRSAIRATAVVRKRKLVCELPGIPTKFSIWEGKRSSPMAETTISSNVKMMVDLYSMMFLFFKVTVTL